MQITTAIKHLQKEAEFLGMPLLETLQFIKQNPLAQCWFGRTSIGYS
jgi:hypothetical protein